MDRFSLLDGALSSEILKLGEGMAIAERLESGLLKAKIIRPGEKLLAVSDCSVWHQGGSETFVADSTITVEHERIEKRHVIGKLLFSFASPLNVILASWLRRREVLQAIGVRVPHLYSVAGEAIYEEFIESELAEDSWAAPKLLNDIAMTAARLDYAGFVTLSFLNDLRRAGEKVYYVDFGFDLGDPKATPTSSARAEIERRVPDPYKAKCLQQYETHLNQLAKAPGA